MPHAYVRTEERQRQIVEAALELLAERGADGFTTKALASKVGVTDGNLFRHFDSKGAIVVAALKQLETAMFAHDIEDDLAAGEHALRRLELFFSRRATFVAGQRALGRLIFSEQLIHASGDEARRSIVDCRRDNFKIMRAALSKLEAEGSLRPGVRVEDLLAVIQGLILTFAFERAVDGPSTDRALKARVKQRWETLVTLLTP